MNKQQEKNFRNLIKACKEAERPEDFNMVLYAYSCNSPACVLGHYASRVDLQSTFIIDRSMVKAGDSFLLSPKAEQKEFGISEEEATELFCSSGCGAAKTLPEAIDYLEAFLHNKLKATRGYGHG